MTILSPDSIEFPLTVPVLIVGAGAAGLTAALAARDAGAEVVALERDALPSGSTALSSGLVPAAGTAAQKAKGVFDTASQFAVDILRKCKHEADPALVEALTRASGPAVDWLAARHGVPFTLVEGFLYPGHSILRMHGTPRRTGAELMGYLSEAAARAGAEVIGEARVNALYADGEARIHGVRIVRPDSSEEAIGCAALILACNGFGGNPTMVAAHIPAMKEALFFGHAGNEGDGINWGAALGAATRHMGAYQGHGSVATPHNILITWALMMEGGFQVNALGQRFSNEHRGYSEQSVAVLAQPGGVAWNIYDSRLHQIALQFEDYRNAVEQNAIKSALEIGQLAALLGLPAAALTATLAETRALAAGIGRDGFGRDFIAKPALQPPFHGVKVTAALFHTQGGLVVDTKARVLRPDGTALPNLFAAGGTACGVSGASVEGYLSGNGLLAAVTLGRLAGQQAAEFVRGTVRDAD